jgi:ABC-type antimicrobial peptide transport system permease subunit/class 3 adenylate cyclase
MFLVRRNLTAHPLRSILTALAIALGVAMMLSASVIGQAASQSAERLSQVNETDAVIQSGPGFNTLVFQALLTLVGVIVLFTAGFVIANAFGMAITARLKELGALRTLGMTRRQILNLVLIEAGLLGLAGAVGGLLLGLVLAGLALRLTGMGGNLSVPVWALIASPLIGFTVTVVAALFPALQASRVSPLETLKPESRITHHGTRNALLPASFILLILVGLGLYAFLAKPDVLTALIVLLPAMVILLALVARLMPALVGSVANLARPWLVRWVGQTAGRLAADNLQRHPTRAALTAGAMTAGLTMMIAMSGLLTVVLKGGLLTFVTIAREDRVVFLDITDLTTFRAENSLQVLTEAAPLDPELLARLQALADEGRIELGRMDMTAIPAELTPTPGAPGVFIDPELSLRRGSFDFSEGNVKDALRYFAQGPAVLLLPITAQRLNVQVGDSVSIQTLTGPVDFTVAGIGADVWVMTAFSFTDGQKYFGVTDPTFMGIFVREGQNKEAVLKQVDDIVADYGMVALDFKAILRGFFRIGDQIIGLMNALLLLTVLVAALGVVNTMVINVTERQREIGMLRAIGATQRQVRHMVVAEGATLGLFAVFVAVLLSLVIVLAYLLLVSPNGLQSLGFRLNWETVRNGFLPALPVMAQATLAALIFAPLIAGLAAYYPAKQAAALDVMEATRSERLTLQPSATRRVEGEPERGLPRSLPLLLAQRALSQNQTRTILSILAVALGAAMTIAGDVVGGAIVNALSQAEDVRAVAEGVFGQIDPILKGIGAAITVAAGFLVFNTFLMSITQRRQQIGVLRSLGMTRGQVLRSVLTEALITGGVGVALGLIAGPLMGKGIIALIKSFDSPILGAFKERETSPLIFALALGLGLGITVLAALIPARQATRISPLVALRAEDLPGADRSPVRLGLIGFAILLLITTYLVLSPPARWIQPPLDLPFTLVFCVLWVVGIALALPAAIGGVARALAGVLTRLWGATGRLMADNLQRGRMRVVLTIASLAVGLTLIVAVSGFFQFYTREVFGPALLAARDAGGWTITTFGIQGGPAGFANRESLRIPREQVEKTRAFVGDRGAILESYFVIVPELSYFYDSYFSFVIDPRFARDSGTFYFQFAEGSWDTALPILDSGCGLLLTPGVARKNNAGLGDTITVKGKDGPVQCTIAGIGQTFVGATIIGSSAQDQFVSGDPFALLVTPAPGEDAAQLEADLQSFVERNGLQMLSLRELVRQQFQVLESVPLLFNGFLLLAILAAALGVVNTTLLSVTERRREFGQLRAVGATRAQVRAIVVGEAALIGFIGGLVGMVAGVGFVLMLALVYGGNAMGVANYQPYSAAVSGLRPGLLTGLIGLLVSPLVCAIAAYLPANAILRGAAIETLNPEQPQPLTRRRIAGLLNRGSLQTRFVLGTSVLLAVVLGSLIAVVTSHAGNYLEARTRDGLAAMLAWNATIVEMGLPADADNLTISNLQSQSQFGAEGMLRFKSLLDDMSANGLVDMSIADRDNIVLFSLDTRDIGTTLPPLDSTEKTAVRSERAEDDTPQLAAAAPIQNSEGALVGSIRMTMRLEELRAFMGRLRNALWSFGTAILVVGLAVSWALSRPFVGAARQLAMRAGRVAHGDYSLMERPKARGLPGSNLSIRARLTVALVLLVAVMVSVLGLVVIPIERRQVERTVRDGMLTAAEFIGEAMSVSLGEGMPSAQAFNLQSMLSNMPNLNFARLREVSEQARSDDIAYMAVVNNDGVILLADDVTLMGEAAPTTTETHVEDEAWKGEDIWVAATPLRRGREGEQIGTLRLGVRRTGMEAFLDESRNLFWLTGLIAVLAGILLAQGIGGAVTAPVQELVTGARRVARGDLAVRFRADTRDELAQLAGAYNEMVAGLRDRERVRDLFGRYVSREVSEAVLSGRVSLKGERKTITALYVDMRGSTAFAEAHPPEEVMAALNQYFEVVILATETYGGIVNRFVGDEAVCVFGAPSEQPDHAEQAVQAALAMRVGLAYLNRKRAALGLPTLRFGMGINTGEVVAGATGSEERQEYTVIGDAMNLGARIQDLNKTFPEHGVLLSEFTLAALGASAEDYEFADLGAVEIRGKSQPVRVYGVVGRRGIQ